MSVKVMGIVWESNLPQREKYVLLAYADHADHFGSNVFPSIGLIAWKTGYAHRSIQRITKSLLKNGLLVEDGTSKYGTKRYRIDLERLPKLPPYCKGIRVSPEKYRGDNLTGDEELGGDNLSLGGDRMTPMGVTNATLGGDIAVSPEPSINHQLTISRSSTPAPTSFSKFSESETAQLVEKFNTSYREAEALYQQVTGQVSIPPSKADMALRTGELILDYFQGDLSKAVDHCKVDYAKYCSTIGRSGKPYSPLGLGWMDWALERLVPRPEAPSGLSAELDRIRLRAEEAQRRYS
jgi:hypothetical protein